MLSSDEGENDLFFDSSDCFLVEEPVVAKEEFEGGKLEYEIWMNEPQSIKERRENFLRGMDHMVEFAKSLGERITDCSGAVPSSSFSSVNNGKGIMACCDREMICEANLLVDESEKEQNISHENENVACAHTKGFEQKETRADLDACKNAKVNRKKFKKWWKHFLSVRKGVENRLASNVSKPIIHDSKTNRMFVQPNKKGYMELTAVFMAQEIQAHKGFIWTMKFSPDGRYLASGGEDGVVRIWRVTSTDASSKLFLAESSLVRKLDKEKSGFGRKKMINLPTVIPNKIFQIEESPVHEFHGHSSDVLDLAWSSTNLLLSSSMDKVVCLWQIGCNQCLNVFHHNNYVTCIQFNPIDDNYFISGSIDGKVRIWGVSEKRVIHWVDVRNIVTAISYHPSGKEFVVGSLAGTCHFYEASGNDVNLEAEIHLHGRRKTSGNKITSIQFLQDESHKVMITSEDSRLRIFDGVDIVGKFKGLPKSGSQMSASLTSTRRHIISVGEDCHVYVWKYNDLCLQTSKNTKSVRSCEHFYCEDVSVAIPWLAQNAGWRHSDTNNCGPQLPIEGQIEGPSWMRDSERFSLGSWFSIDGSYKGSATWPEEKLPLWDAAVVGEEYYKYDWPQVRDSGANYKMSLPETWGLVIVAGGWNGTIRTFHNYGLPVGL